MNPEDPARVGRVVSSQVTAPVRLSRWSAHPGRTYWDHTQLRFPRREGRRIDLVPGSPVLAARVSGARIDREEREGTGASDHAPVGWT